MSLGNCFVSAGTYLMNECLFDKEKRKHLRLVHGLPQLTVPPHIRYGHAWVEIDNDTVYDAEKRKEIPAELYYAVGNIDRATCFKYSYKEMSSKVTEHHHWGPWDLEDTPEERKLRNG